MFQKQKFQIKSKVASLFLSLAYRSCTELMSVEKNLYLLDWYDLVMKRLWQAGDKGPNAELKTRRWTDGGYFIVAKVTQKHLQNQTKT